MANQRYVRGAAFERDVKKLLESKGFRATRSAGSKGEFDVWAHNNNFLVLIQCKAGASDATAKKVMEQLEKDFEPTKFPTMIAVVAKIENNNLIGFRHCYGFKKKMGAKTHSDSEKKSDENDT